MRKIFIDCGAYDGCSVRMFLDKPNAHQFEIFSFEPNPSLAKYHPVYPSIFFNKAVWIKNGTIDFYQHGVDGGSTLIKIKSDHNNQKTETRPHLFSKSQKITVECIDLSEWIKDNFSSNDYIILKTDIEGAEYEVLEKICNDGTIQYINEIYSEFHRTRCGVSKARERHLVKNIKKHGISIKEWDAMTLKYLKETNCSEFKLSK